MIIAVPKYGTMIAPCFETAGNFLIAIAEDRKIILSRLVTCGGCRGFSRVNLLKENKVDVLICGGIKAFYRNLLSAANIQVLAPINIEVEKAVDLYLHGVLKSMIETDDEQEGLPPIPLDDLICWAKELFTLNGFRIVSDPQTIPFPIDFLAEIECPLCGKTIIVAVCCGAHIYRSEFELKEFERVSRLPKYHARIYIHPKTPTVANICAESGMDLIDPFAESTDVGPMAKKAIPLLKTPIIGHERAFSITDNHTETG